MVRLEAGDSPDPRSVLPKKSRSTEVFERSRFESIVLTAETLGIAPRQARG